jgi:hypothetical protein
MASKIVRCAVYTRKSSEEGLEQSFNSLKAQRDACLNFVLSQKHEGWTALDDQYDDGGFSGGTMERPALMRLLADINAGKVDTAVVYKVDRLTRSLMDFSRGVRFTRRQLRFCDPSVQHHDSNGPTDPKRLAFIRAVRARSNGRTDSGQSCSFQEKGYVDGRCCLSWVRLHGQAPHRQFPGSEHGSRNLPSISSPRECHETQKLFGKWWGAMEA